VVADRPVGIDVERVIPRREHLYEAVGSDAEWELLGGRTWPAFFRVWTAKEATLKANSRGIADLLECRIIARTGPETLLLHFARRTWKVAHALFENHVAAVTAVADAVEWHWEPGGDR
jgi:phosphopantetheinyl transferase